MFNKNSYLYPCTANYYTTMNVISSPDRRRFVKRLGSALLVPSTLSMLPSCSGNKPEGTQAQVESDANASKKKLGLALVGLGNYSNGQLAPALQETQQCYLAGVVTGTPSKAEEWKQKYDIPDKNIYNYDTFDQIADNPDIDIIYVVLPNAMHAEYVIRAAKAGKHVITEKPMEVSVEKCQQMIDACNENDVKLGVGYRLHFEPYNQEMMRLGQEKVFGAVQSVEADFGFTIGDPTQWRLDKELAGGGALMDVGIYTIQGCCYTLGEDPVSVVAEEFKTDKQKFAEVDETIHFTLKFPSGVEAKCKTSYNENYNRLRADAETGWFELAPAYDYGPLAGKTSEGPMDFPQILEQARHMDAFAESIVQGTEFKTPGEMGLRDMKIIEAIYQSIADGGKEVKIA